MPTQIRASRFALLLLCLTAMDGWCAASGGAQAWTGPVVGPRRPAFPLSREALQRLNRALVPLHAQYDRAAQMLREPFRSPGYHTTLTGGFVHPTRSSLQYAVALLDTGDELLRQRAEAILRRVISLQDRNPQSKTCGIWPWFLEEPLDRMSPPDWNWADFCGVALLQVALDHRLRLSPEVARLVDEAILCAAKSIQHRNVGPAYTNIAIMGCYVTLVASELYELADLRSYALDRWRRFCDYTMRHGAFTEYNSPTYTIVALKELGRMRLDVHNADARRMVEEIYRLAWVEIANHFHPPTRQWAGPHSRCYSTLLGTDVLALIQRGTDGRANFRIDKPSLDEARLPLPCPAGLEPLFTALNAPRELRQTFVESDPPVVGTTYLTPDFALGSVNRGDLWNQRRALLAYWGTARTPAYLHLRFLHDGYDFSAAQFFSVQQGGNVLAAINFAMDGGDRHVSLDRLKNGVVQAKDLRLRFEFGGAAKGADFAAMDPAAHRARLRFGDLRLHLAVPHAVFGTNAVRWETGRDQGKAWIDVVVYAGDPRLFDLAALEHAALGVAVRLTTSSLPAPELKSHVANAKLALHWDALQLEIPVRPATAAELQRQLLATREGEARYETK